VATLNLPAGLYVATATGMIDNNTPATNATISCQLVLGSNVNQQVDEFNDEVLGAQGAPGSSDAFSMTGANTLESASTAKLRCLSSAANTVVDIPSITAIKVGAIH
jgi:hypothetical protein